MIPKPYGQDCPTCGGQMMTDSTSAWCSFIGEGCKEPRRELPGPERRRVLKEEFIRNAQKVKAQK